MGPKMRRKMKRQDTAEQEDLFAPKPKDKIKDEFAEKEKKPKEEEEKIVITPAVLPAKPEPAVKAIPEVPEEEAEETKRAEKDKVRDEFEEKERKRKEEEEKIIIKPAVLPEKKPEESSEEESEEEEEEAKPGKKKLSKADLKPAVQIKVAIEEDKPKRMRKKQESFDADANVLFGGEPTPKV